MVFHPLDDANIRSIAGIQLQRLQKRLAALEIGFKVDDSALVEIAKAGFDPVYGARPLKRAIQQEIENPLAKQILEGHFAAKDTIVVKAAAGVISFTKDAPEKLKKKAA